jgi:hypothetical protein
MATTASPLAGGPSDSDAAATRPSSISEKYSVGPKFSAYWAMTGAKPIITRIPMEPPAKDATAVMNSATEARPCCAIG